MKSTGIDPETLFESKLIILWGASPCSARLFSSRLESILMEIGNLKKRESSLEKTIDMAKKLISIDSTTHSSNLDIIDFIQPILEANHFAVERLAYTDQHGEVKANLIAKKGEGAGGFGIFCHSDCVPPGGEEWEPFTPSIENGRLIGRGSCDMKGALAAAIVAGNRIEADKLSQPYYLVITADEENGMMGAMKVAAESSTLKQGWPLNGVVAEPTSLIPIYAHKGAVRMYITAYGRGAHTSTDKGLSANFLIAPFLSEMAALAETLKSDERFMDSEFQPSTNGFNMVIDDGGCNPNVTPAKTVCTISLRTMPDGNSDQAVNMILESVKKHRLECRHFRVNPFYVAKDSDILRAALDITGCAKGETAPYGTEALFYQDYVDLVILGPGDINQAHTVGEWVEIDQLQKSVSYYQQLIDRFCCQPNSTNKYTGKNR